MQALRNLGAMASKTTPSATIPTPALAISAISGQHYPKKISEELAQKKFKSNVWLTETQMKLADVTLKPKERENGYSLTTIDGIERGVIYNASQTSSPERVEALTGKLGSFMALTGTEFSRGLAIAFVKYAGMYPSNEWVTAKQVNMLELKLKPGARAVNVAYSSLSNSETVEADINSTDPEATIPFYNVSDLETPEIMKKMRNLYPISASSGRRYTRDIALRLLRAVIKRGFDSPFWLTLGSMQNMGLRVKGNLAGTTILVNQQGKELVLFNASQTNAPNKVATETYRAQFHPRSAMSGALYPEPTSSELSAAALRYKHKSIYWLTFKQASFLGVEILKNQKPVEVRMGDGTVQVYNANQTTDREKLESRFTKKHV